VIVVLFCLALLIARVIRVLALDRVHVLLDNSATFLVQISAHPKLTQVGSVIPSKWGIALNKVCMYETNLVYIYILVWKILPICDIDYTCASKVAKAFVPAATEMSSSLSEASFPRDSLSSSLLSSFG